MAKNGVFSRIRKLENVEGGDDLAYGDSNEVHVLAVDDSHIDRKVIERLLKITSCKVTAVESGRSALQFLGLDTEDSPVGFHGLKVDLIITDYCMPGMTGYELLKKIKGSSNFREIPVVIMSSENVLTRIDRCLEEGAEDFIMKPVKLSDVKRLKSCMFGEGRVRSQDTILVNERKVQESSESPSSSPSQDDFSSSQSPPSVSSTCSPRSFSSSSLSSPSPSPSQPSSPTMTPDSPTRLLKPSNDNA